MNAPTASPTHLKSTPRHDDTIRENQTMFNDTREEPDE